MGTQSLRRDEIIIQLDHRDNNEKLAARIFSFDFNVGPCQIEQHEIIFGILRRLTDV